ncbi:hypothetical protein HB991_09170 [Yersinia mollaretii]|uniref:Uncharacterized protein n=1 Tax=Yersinia mollaretii TaxID=33060 RepID=A0AA44CKX6_YERMO|nr:hypothetical protein [Yersinia mollaretii]NIL22684.1 hypothetical protein [Yersinia mollaretii]CNJ47134.1 Uncharacterised protein [Yersinia mollaretii]
MQYRYGWEKFHTAIHSLAGFGAQQERLLNAYIFSLSHINPDVDLPEYLREEFTELSTSLTRKPAQGDEGTAYATIYAMREDEIHQAIDSIISIYDSVCREMPKG